MRNSEEVRRTVEEIEYLLAKRKLRTVERPRFVVVHGHHQPGTACHGGETIEQVFLGVGRRLIALALSPTGLVVVDILARKRSMLLSAAQIEQIAASHPFYTHLGANTASKKKGTIRLARRSIKVFISRFRRLLAKASAQAGLEIHPEKILVSEPTDLLNITAYRIALPCEFVHVSGNSIG
ncbi:MAG: hypothetical protein ACLGSH_13820 [Acidobacteriota bacterium]